MPLTPQVSALVTMYSYEEDIDSAIDVFKQAIEHYQSEQVCFQCFVFYLIADFTCAVGHLSRFEVA